MGYLLLCGWHSLAAIGDRRGFVALVVVPQEVRGVDLVVTGLVL